MEFRPPSLILYLDFVDANDLVAGVLYLKGINVIKSKSASDCISILENSCGIDLILLNRQTVEDDFLVLKKIKEISPGIMIVILSDKVSEDEELHEHNIDELVLTPISPENLADKILMMMAKRELKRVREESK